MKKQLFTATLMILMSLLVNAQYKVSLSDIVRKQLNNNSLFSTNNQNNNETYIISDSYSDKNSGIIHTYLQQTFNGIKIFNSIKSLAIRNDSIIYQSGNFINYTSNTEKSQAIQANSAIEIAALNLALPKVSQLTQIQNNFSTENKILFNPANIAKQNITAELVWIPIDSTKSLRLAWNISIDVLSSPDFWLVSVDANEGTIIGKSNYTIYENTPSNQYTLEESDIDNFLLDKSTFFNNKKNGGAPVNITGNFNVIPFPTENRFIGSIASVSNPWTITGTNNANTYGWNYDGSNSYAYTRGNNVYAYVDSAGLDKPGFPANSSTQLPPLSFNASPDFTTQPSTPINREFSSTNLFYWNNMMHDVFYQYGFDEAAGNFQQNNMGRGGIGGDYVKAESQYGNGTGKYVNNANFTTPADGLNGIMRMYLYNPIFGNLTIHTPSTLAGIDTFREGKVSPYNYLRKTGTITGQLVYFNDDAAGTVHNACVAPTNNVSGKIVFIYSTGCNYTVKIKNAQNAGAIAVLVGRYNGPSVAMGGTDSTITIPAVMVSTTDGNKIAASLSKKDSVSITLASGVYFDGAIDNSINTHEYTHGISNRLTGGPSNSTCLSNQEEGGEGWSDYVGAMMTTNWANTKLSDSGMVKTHASYADNQTPGGLGGRTYPYTTNMTIDPHTYADVANPTYAGEVHYIGEVWCSVLWDMTWNIIKQEGTINPKIYDVANGGGNVIALQLMINGLKLQPCSPGFLDARDAILAADSILFNYKHKCAIWSAFARRGMGFSAIQGSSNSTTDQVAAFDVPNCTLPLQLISFTVSASNNQIILNWNTAAEYNTQSFIIQVSSNGTEWKNLDTVLSKNGTSENNYAYLDKQPLLGNNYFRLIMTNKDGSFSLSNIANVNFYEKYSSKIYPNPANNSLFVQLHNITIPKVILQISDVTGKVLIEQTVENQNKVATVDVSNLAKGSYILTIKGDKEVQRFFIKD